MSGFRPAGPEARARAYDRQQEQMAARTEALDRRIEEIIAEAEGDRREWWIEYQTDRLEQLGR